MNKKGQEGLGITIAIIAVLGFIALCIFGLRIVEYNEYAVQKEFGKIIPEIRNTGFNMIGIGTLIRVNNQIRNYEIIAESASSDYQNVKLFINLNIKIKKDKVIDYIRNYRSEDTYTQYLNNKIQEKIKAIVLKYDAETILNTRINISKELYDNVKTIPELEYFEINDLSIPNIEFSEEFNNKLEQKAQVLIDREIILRQNENIKLIGNNMDEIKNMNDYFKYQLIEKWDGISDLVISEALIR